MIYRALKGGKPTFRPWMMKYLDDKACVQYDQRQIEANFAKLFLSARSGRS